MFDPQKSLIHVDVRRLHVHLRDLAWADAMESSVAGTEETLASELRKFCLKLLSISIYNISFTVDFSADSVSNGCEEHVRVCGAAESISITTGSSNLHLSYVLVDVAIIGGELEITHVKKNDIQSVFRYAGRRADVRVDYQVYSRRMTARMALTGTDLVHVVIEPFLTFYRQYQAEEDNSLERKMVRAPHDLDGKLQSVSVSSEVMQVTVEDQHRVSESLAMELTGLQGAIFTTWLPSSPNRSKTITMDARTVRWLGCDAMVSGVSAKKQLFVVNEQDFVDVEILECSCQRASFLALDTSFLRWMCVAMDTLDCLPQSRFAHTKKSTMNAHAAYILVSLSPSVAGEVHSPQNKDDKDLATKMVSFEYEQFSLRKSVAAYSEDSLCFLSCAKLEIHSELNLSELSERSSVELSSNTPKMRMVGCLFRFQPFRFRFMSGAAALVMESAQADKYEVLLTCSSTRDLRPLFATSDLDIRWPTPNHTQVAFGQLRGSLSSLYMIRYHLSFSGILAAISRGLGVLRSVKECKYGPAPVVEEDPYALDIDCSGLSLHIAISLELRTAICLTSQRFKLSSRGTASTYSFDRGAIMFRLHEDRSDESDGIDGSVEEPVVQYERLEVARCFKHDNANSDDGVYHTDISLSKLRMRIIAAPIMGTLLDGYLSFINQYLGGGAARVSINEPPSSVMYRVQCDSMEIVFYTGNMEPISRCRASEVNIIYDCTDTPTNTNKDLIRYDNLEMNDVNLPIDYHAPSGGKLRISVTSLRGASAAFGREFVLLERSVLTGKLYSASVAHPAVVCTFSHTLFPCIYSEDTDMLCYLLKETRSAPYKYYGDVLLTLDRFELTYSDEISECLAATTACFSRAYPPSSAPSSTATSIETDTDISEENQQEPPHQNASSLSAFDACRYWWHGSLSLVCGSLKIVLTPTATPNNVQSQVQVKLEQIRVCCRQLAFLELQAYNVAFTLKHRTKPTSSSHYAAITGSGVEKIDVVVMPVTSHAPLRSASHHDVYLSPSTSSDMYELFRTKPASLTCHSVIRCVGRENHPVFLFLRLDCIKLLLDTFNQPTTTTSTTTNSTTAASVTATNHTTTPISFQSMLRSLELQVDIEKLCACSWASATECHGFVFSQEHFNLYLRLHRADTTLGALGVPGALGSQQAYSEFLGVRVDRLMSEVRDVDVHVREWRLNSQAKSASISSRRLSRTLMHQRHAANLAQNNNNNNPAANASSSLEQQLQAQFDPLFKVVHASRLRVSLTEDSAADSLSSTADVGMPTADGFVPTSNAVTMSPSAAFSFNYVQQPPAQRNRHSSMHSTFVPSTSFRASLLHFSTNHAAFVPPLSAVPRSHQVWRRSIESQVPLPAYLANYTTEGLSATDPSSIEQQQQQQAATKLWSLKLLDLRLLWTTDIRDSIFSYFGDYFERFAVPDEPAVETTGTTGTTGVAKALSTPTTTSINASAKAGDVLTTSSSATVLVDTSNETASLQDFIEGTASTTAKHQQLPRPLLTQIRSSSKLMNSGTTHHPSQYEQHALTTTSKRRPSRGGESSRVLYRTVQDVSMQKHFLSCSSGNSTQFKKNHTAVTSAHNSNITKSAILYPTTQKRTIAGAAGDASNVRRRSSNDPSTGSGDLSSVGGSSRMLDGIRSHRGPLFYRSLDEQSTNSHNSPLLSQQPSVANITPPNPYTNTGLSPLSGGYADANATGSEYITYFIIELVDPQLNFLDTKSGGSLICCTGISSLEGRHQRAATLCDSQRDERSVSPLFASNLAGAGGGSGEANGIEPKRKNEIRLRMNNVSAFTASTNISGEGHRVHWRVDTTSTNTTNATTETGAGGGNAASSSTTSNAHPHHDRRKGTTNQNRFIKVAIEDFRLRSSYTFWAAVTKREAASMRVISTRDDLVCSFKLDIPNLLADVESDQFYTILNVVRNVMLSPPPVLNKGSTRAKQAEQQSKQAEKSSRRELHRNRELMQRYDLKMAPTLDINSKASRDELRVLVEEATKEPLDIEVGIARFVECFVGRGKWIMRSSDDGRALVEAGFTGVYATYSFHEDRSTVSVFEVQRFWARSFNASMDMYHFQPTSNIPTGVNSSSNTRVVNSSSNTSSVKTQNISIAAATAAVSGGVTASVVDDKSWILMPILTEYEYCYRCKNSFKTIENEANACVFHADADGNEGEYKVSALVGVTNNIASTGGALPLGALGVARWTCCGKTEEDAPGCSFRPHVCKETMLSIRAEAYPATFIDNVELNILQSLEISIFPGASYDLRVRITSSLSEILHGYFSVDAPDIGATGAAGAVVGTQGINSQDSVRSGAGGVDNLTTKQGSQPAVAVSSQPQRRRSSNIFASPVRRNDSVVASSGDEALGADSRVSSRRMAGNILDSSGAMASSSLQQQQGPRQEGFYFKYLRVGDINVALSTSGFAFNVDNYRAAVEPFVKRGEVMSWNRFVWELEKHATWSLTVNTAATSFGKLGKLFNIGVPQTLQLPSSASSSGQSREDNESSNGATGGGGGGGGGANESAVDSEKLALLLGKVHTTQKKRKTPKATTDSAAAHQQATHTMSSVVINLLSTPFK